MTGRTWWHRNRWGALALVPVLALAAWVTTDNYRTDYDHRQRPSVRVAVAGDGSAVYADAVWRWSAAQPDPPLESADTGPYRAPTGTRPWKVTVHLQADAHTQQAIETCLVTLVDQQGRQFGAGPDELPPVLTSSAGCGPDTSLDTSAAPPTRYDVTFYFLLPSTATPRRLRIVILSRLPRYAELPAPA